LGAVEGVSHNQMKADLEHVGPLLIYSISIAFTPVTLARSNFGKGSSDTTRFAQQEQ